MIVVIAGAFLLATVGLFILIAVIANKNKEKGLIEDIKTIHEDWVPITLIIDMGIHDSVVKFNMQEAIDFWNKGMDMRLFANVSDIDRGAIIPVIYAALNNAFARTVIKLSDTGRPKAARIELDEDKIKHASDSELTRALAHELGHLLGLDHDNEQKSVMYGKLSNWSYKITDADKKLLKDIYKRS